MKNKKVYRIRIKGTQDYISLGYTGRSSWNTYPSQAIAYGNVTWIKEFCEVVCFEYQLVEQSVIEFK